jgi:hypothetical protein
MLRHQCFAGLLTCLLVLTSVICQDYTLSPTTTIREPYLFGSYLGAPDAVVLISSPAGEPIIFDIYGEIMLAGLIIGEPGTPIEFGVKTGGSLILSEGCIVEIGSSFTLDTNQFVELEEFSFTSVLGLFNLVQGGFIGQPSSILVFQPQSEFRIGEVPGIILSRDNNQEHSSPTKYMSNTPVQQNNARAIYIGKSEEDPESQGENGFSVLNLQWIFRNSSTFELSEKARVNFESCKYCAASSD